MLDLASAGVGLASIDFRCGYLKAFGEEADRSDQFADIFALSAARANTDHWSW